LRGRLGGGLGRRLLSVLSHPSDIDWDELEETLLKADIGVEATEAILKGLRGRLKGNRDTEARSALREELLSVLDPSLDRSLAIGAPGAGKGAPVVMVGVNGAGKTTTVGKMAHLLVEDGYSVIIGAADTFRAAAADQVATWGSRIGVEVVRSDTDGSDPAAVAFEASERAREISADVVLVDTAGRLQNKRDLMDELGKILRVLSRHSPIAEVLLVLDATTGQNGLAQAKVFAEVASVTGIVLAKLDGSAKGGIVIQVERELGVPVKFVGLGERADDLAPFDPGAFVDGMLG
jgi:fused signal recognition particle receptor